MTKIVIIYGTRFGSAEEIAIKIKDKADEKGIEVVLLDAKEKKLVEQIFWDLSQYDGILLGSGIQIGKWTKAMSSILEQHGHALKMYAKPLGLYASCGTAGDSDKAETACNDFVDKIAEKYELTPTVTVAFGGIYDFTKKSRHGKIKSKLLQKIVEKEYPGVYDMAGINDLRDWDRIDQFTADFFAKI